MTLKDVAREAGVSAATVSYVLTGKKRISPEVTERVLAAVRKTKYKLNTAARALRVGGSRTLGLMIPDITNPFFPRLAQEVKHQARALGYAVILTDTSYSASNELEDLEFLHDKGIDGIIWVPSETDIPEMESSVPVVLIDQPKEGYATVHADDFGGGRLQARYLCDRGHRSIIVVSGPQTLRAAAERRSGFLHEIAERAIEITLDIEAPFSLNIPNEIEQRIIRGAESATAIACGNDALAIGVMKRLLDNGIDVPGDVSIIGFDNNMMADYVRPPLTTIAQSTEKLGSLAVNLVVGLIHNPASIREDVVVPVTVVERESVRPIGVRPRT